MTDDVFTAGRLTETQVKYALESGFMSIVSLWNETMEGNLGEEVLPTSDGEKDIATRLAQPGREYAVVVVNKEDWQEIETARKFGEIYSMVQKPILFHCDNAYKSTYVALLHFVNSSDSEHDLTRNSTWFYYKGSGLGFDFYDDESIRKHVTDISGEVADPEMVAKPDLAVVDWYTKYWMLKPVYKEWYVSGQIQTNHIAMIDAMGFVNLINARRGVVITNSGAPSQEEVTLLNIRDRTGTYTGAGRQTTPELMKNRPLWFGASNEYISPTSTVNYQSINHLQFGDEIGYNETLEQAALQGKQYTYLHTPVGE